MSIATRTTTLLALSAIVLGCQRTEPRTAADTQVAPRPLTESPGALASRRETQDAVERARLAIERKDLQSAKSELTDAAAFLRTEAQQAAGDVQTLLRRAADDLDGIGNRIANGQVKSVAALVTASLAVNRAEAAFHLDRAKDAIANAENTRAGEELTMTIDHLERAAKDAGRESDAVIRSAIADARTLAGELMKGVTATPDNRTKVTDGLANAIARVGASVKVTKES